METFNYQSGTIYQGDVLECARRIASNSVDCVITSPPYWQLRSYGFDFQWGLEPTYKEYLAHLQELMTELWRIVKPTGTVWINLGDTYGTFRGMQVPDKFERENGNWTKHNQNRPDKNKQLEKCLLLIPHRFAIDCIDNGWILRNDVIWAKPNGMPESVTDRFSKKHEFMFFFVKQQKYYFDLDSVREKARTKNLKLIGNSSNYNEHLGVSKDSTLGLVHPLGKNCGDVSDFWEIPTKPSANEHYASYNLDLIKKPILAGCPPDGVIYDPFMGTATTAVAAMKYGRRFIGSEGSADYMKIANSNILETEKQIAYEQAQQKIF